MKVSVKSEARKNDFIPFTLELHIESMEEAHALRYISRSNCSVPEVVGQAYKIPFTTIQKVLVWGQAITDELRSQRLE